MQDLLLKAKNLAEVEPDEALRICNDILNKSPSGKWAEMALFMIGYIFLSAERFGLAYNIYERCAQLTPKRSEVYSNMGMCLEQSDPHKAMRLFQKAYRLDPNNAMAYANEGLSHLLTGNPKRCVELSDKALKINPDLVSAKHNKGLALLMLRQWREGWQLYFDTLGVKHRERRDYGLPDWNGETGTVIVYGEQGVGDEIMFASCLPDLMKTNRVIFDCDSRLEGLFRRSFDIPVYGTRFKSESPILDKYTADYQCAIGQLPKFYRSNEESFSGRPYLTADPERRIQWRALFDTFKGKKIGIAWSGGNPHTGQKKRSFELADFKPLLDTDNTFISLEYKDTPQDLLDQYGVKSYSRATRKGGDIDDLAGLIAELDCVVTACTTVVYVAGALGVPCFVLVPDEPGYRYHKEGGFPWYESVDLVRFKDGWESTIEGIKDKVC